MIGFDLIRHTLSMAFEGPTQQLAIAHDFRASYLTENFANNFRFLRIE